MDATAQLQCVIRDRAAIGFVLSAGRRGWNAFDSDGCGLGLFPSEKAAARAVYEQAAADDSSLRLP
jgi:hypothetical protein